MPHTRSTAALLALAMLALALPACSGPRHAGPAGSGGSAGNTALLARYLTGAFSSAAQAATDPENFFDIRLHATEIWTDRDDGPWLYVEQAAASALDRPYRQRVYHLREPERGVFVSEVYTMPEPLAYAGWWATPDRFDGSLAPDDLTLRDGCSITLRGATNRSGPIVFYGGTVGTGCASSLGEAAYATSEVELFPDRLLTWDRGFTAEGEQAWGATKSGYVFVRTAD